MDKVLFWVQGVGVTSLHLLLAAAGLALLLAVWQLLAAGRASRERMLEAAAASERQRELDDKLAELNRTSAEMAGRMQTFAQVFGGRQTDFVRLVSERLDQVGHRVGQGLDVSARATMEQLSKLNERLGIIDAAQSRLTGLTQEVVGLKDILANKQSRGAFGQGRMEAIVRDNLPPGAYEFQPTLSNKSRPDCIIRLPGDARVMVVDAKFPLEAFTALRDATDEEARKQARAAVRNDVGRHIRDIAERYFLPGETQDQAVLFVPAESVYADLAEHFEDMVQRAHRARILIVSPSLLMMAIQVMQAIVRDARVREQAHQIQTEVRLLVDDVLRLKERTVKLDTHFRQMQEDVAGVTTSADKIARRGERIDGLDFGTQPPVLRAAE